MFSVSDILKLLDQIPIWRSLKALPERVEALEQRISHLEAELERRPPPELCPLCQGEMKLSKVEAHWSGEVEFHTYLCSTDSCNHKRTKRVSVN